MDHKQRTDKARSLAYTKLGKKYSDERIALYREFGGGPRLPNESKEEAASRCSKAFSRARVELSHLHWEEYKLLYNNIMFRLLIETCLSDK